MARYNSVNSTGSVAGGTAISTPASGLLTTLTGTGTVTLPNPVLYAGSTQTFYNSTGAAITLSTPSGVFTGPGTGGASTLGLPASSILTVVSDGTNYIAQAWLGGNLTTNGTATFNGTIAANPTNLSVSIQPTGTGVLTLSSGTTGSLDNVNVGATTTGTGRFSTLTATGTVSTTATTVATLGTTGTGALQVAGGASVAGIFNVGGAGYYAGNVGIGTTPNKKLEVLGVGEIIRATSTTAANDQLISIKNNSGTADTSTNIFFADRYAASSYASSYIRGTSSGASALIFATGGTNFSNIYDAGAPTERMRINAAGAVGVGNAPFQWGASTSVGAELSIQSSNTTNAALTVQAGLSRYWIATPFGTNQLQIGGNGGSMPATGAINIDPNGIVGIGTDAPTIGYAGAISNVKLALRGGTVGGNGGVATMLIGSDNNHYSSISSTHTGGGLTYLTLSTSQSVSNPIERLRIASSGQLYHNTNYLVATAYNHYWAKSLTAISPTSAGWTDVQLQWSNVFLPTDVKKVLLTFHVTFRNNGVNVNHSGFRIRATRTSDNAVTYVGNASWGFGISQCVGNQSAQNHATITQHVNLLDYDAAGNQAGLAAGSTYNMMLQVYDAYGNGTTLRLAAEAGNTHEAYTPAHGSIWVI